MSNVTHFLHSNVIFRIRGFFFWNRYCFLQDSFFIRDFFICSFCSSFIHNWWLLSFQLIVSEPKLVKEYNSDDSNQYSLNTLPSRGTDDFKDTEPRSKYTSSYKRKVYFSLHSTKRSEGRYLHWNLSDIQILVTIDDHSHWGGSAYDYNFDVFVGVGIRVYNYQTHTRTQQYSLHINQAV